MTSVTSFTVGPSNTSVGPLPSVSSSFASIPSISTMPIPSNTVVATTSQPSIHLHSTPTLTAPSNSDIMAALQIIMTRQVQHDQETALLRTWMADHLAPKLRIPPPPPHPIPPPSKLNEKLVYYIGPSNTSVGPLPSVSSSFASIPSISTMPIPSNTVVATTSQPSIHLHSTPTLTAPSNSDIMAALQIIMTRQVQHDQETALLRTWMADHLAPKLRIPPPPPHPIPPPSKVPHPGKSSSSK
uniref:Uncharacterized protein LOC113785483 n=1 Tax=Cicer arietinum TaxID=3827 RepID=A0A3Q7XM66_CICAR|nr:uncharacterized protein LOC113785483 [Cicer arietinum]